MSTFGCTFTPNKPPIMKFTTTLLLAMFSVGVIAQKDYKNYVIKKSNNIVVDGNISDWEGIPFTDSFVNHSTGASATQSTEAKLAWDNDNLYLCFYVKDTQIKTTAGPQDSKIFSTDDLIEFFIDADDNGANYIEVGVNAENVYYDYILKCVSSSCGGWQDDQAFDLAGFSSSASYLGTLNSTNGNDTSYTIEIKIPFSSLNAIPNGGFTTPTNGTTWRGNLFRVDQGGSSAEYLSWSPHNSHGFHQPSKFGSLTFSDEIVTSSQIATVTSINVYPNPTVGAVHLSATADLVQVFNAYGQLVYTAQNVSSFDLTSQGAGTYYLKISKGTAIATKQLVIVQ